MASLCNLPHILLIIHMVLPTPTVRRLFSENISEPLLLWQQELSDEHRLVIWSLNGNTSANLQQIQVDVHYTATSNGQRSELKLMFDEFHKLVGCTFRLYYDYLPVIPLVMQFNASSSSMPTYLEQFSFTSTSEFYQQCGNMRHPVAESAVIRHRRSALGIMPGTLWCGKGNIATPQRIFGSEIEADVCCRAHDKCFENIRGLTTKWGYRNHSPVTISNCQCDDEFLECLENAGTEAAVRVGTLFFNVFRVPCFRREKTTVCTLANENGTCRRCRDLNKVVLYAPQRFIQSYAVWRKD